MKRALVVVFFGAFLLSGCSGKSTSMEEALNTWVGSDINRVIERFGPPSDEYQMSNGRIIYTWYYDGGVVANPTYGGGAEAYRYYCEVAFITDREGIIGGWRWEGNSC